jgi:hypothetical protein
MAGEMRERSFGIKIPPTNLKPDFETRAAAFANKACGRGRIRGLSRPRPTRSVRCAH